MRNATDDADQATRSWNGGADDIFRRSLLVKLTVILARLFAFLVSAMLVGCQLLVGTSLRPSGDTQHRETYRVEVGEQVVQFSIPPRESAEFFPNYVIPTRTDLNREDLFDEALEGPGLLSRI